MAEFIAKQTEFYKQVRHGKPLPVAQLLHNPGLLRGHGTDNFGYAQYDADDTGWAALRARCRNSIDERLSLSEFFAGWCHLGRDRDAYQRCLRAASSHFGVLPDSPLINLVNENILGTGWKVRTSTGLLLEGEKWQANVVNNAGRFIASTGSARR